jgi:hypothetical protein
MGENKYAVTRATVDSAITQEIYIQGTNKTQICIIVLNTGFEAVGSRLFTDECDLDASEKKTVVRELAFEKATQHIESIAQWQKVLEEMLKKEPEDINPPAI